MSNVDGSRDLDWGRISRDYHQYRSGPPTSYYVRLKELGIGRHGQRILDLGTGTGVLAREFARGGACVTGVDASDGQIEWARRAAGDEGLSIEFLVAPAESTPLPRASFGVITANQCWHFFDGRRALAEARRLLIPGGRLVISDYFWIAARDPLAARTEELIHPYNPRWTRDARIGDLPSPPEATLLATLDYEEPIPFTRPSWMGRVRTCRAIGPSLAAGEVAAFDAEHVRMLETTAPERFEILHRIRAFVYELEGSPAPHRRASD